MLPLSLLFTLLKRKHSLRDRCRPVEKPMHFPIDHRLVDLKAPTRSLDTRRVLKAGLPLCQKGCLKIAREERFPDKTIDHEEGVQYYTFIS